MPHYSTFKGLVLMGCQNLVVAVSGETDCFFFKYINREQIYLVYNIKTILGTIYLNLGHSHTLTSCILLMYVKWAKCAFYSQMDDSWHVQNVKLMASVVTNCLCLSIYTAYLQIK